MPTPERTLPEIIRNGNLVPVINHDTDVLADLGRSEFAKTRIEGTEYATKLDQHLRFRQDRVLTAVRPAEIHDVVNLLPARFFEGGTTDAGEPNPDGQKTPENLLPRYKLIQTKSRPKVHPRGVSLRAAEAKPTIVNPLADSYYTVLEEARYELATRDSAWASHGLTGEEAAYQFSYMAELQRIIDEVLNHKSMLLPELTGQAAGEEPDPGDAA